MILQQSPKAVHHLRLVLHKGVGVAVERDGGITVAENLGKGTDVHAAFEGAGGESMAQGVKAAVRELQLFQQQFETALIRAHAHGAAVLRHDKGRNTALFQGFEQGQQLFGQRDEPPRVRGLGLVYNQSVLAVVAGAGHGQRASGEIYVAPLQGYELAHAQPAVQAEHYAEQFVLLPAQHRLLDFFLFGGGEALHFARGEPGAFQAVGGDGTCQSQRAGGDEGGAQHGDDRVHAAAGQSRARAPVASAQQSGQKLLERERRQFFHIKPP